MTHQRVQFTRRSSSSASEVTLVGRILPKMLRINDMPFFVGMVFVFRKVRVSRKVSKLRSIQGTVSNA